MILLRTAHCTDIGPTREQNEDAALARPELVIVSDGMGGHLAGEVASRITVETIQQHLKEDPTPEGLPKAVRRANQAVHSYGQSHPEAQGLGCTVTAGMTTKNALYVAHVGDSRCTRIEDGQLEAMTSDHNVPGRLLHQGRITPAEALVHPHRNILTRSIGTGLSVDIELVRIALRPGQVFLFTTDGVHDALTGDQVLHIVKSQRRASKIAPALVAAALAAGSEDNATCAVLTVHRARKKR